ncbi:MAG TPA: hypothetical protein VHW09_15330 [Bryobacteraceae bacterium]|jgi:hypothetical protein|nr:hypothetical protein [Bryobacteraceae bacterium]
MKIVSQSADELVLHEGSFQGIAVGTLCVIAGALAAYFLHSSKPMALWIGLGVALVGVGVICFASSITVGATRSKDQILYEKKRIVGAKTETYKISEVLRIETRKQWRMEGGGGPPDKQSANPPQPVLVAQSVIVFKSGKELALDHQKNSSSMQVGSAVLMSGQGAETATANRVAAFLGVPFQEIMPPNMMGMGTGGGLNIQIGGR